MILPSDETELSTKNQNVGLSTKKQSDDTTSLKTESNTAKEEGIGTVSGPAVSMIANNNYKEEEAMTMPSESKEFNEEEHPRDQGGQFTSGSGGSKTGMNKERTRSRIESNLDNSQKKILDRFFDNNKIGMPKFDSVRSAGKNWDMSKDLTPSQVKQLDGVDKNEILDYLKKRVASKDKWNKSADIRVKKEREKFEKSKIEQGIRDKENNKKEKDQTARLEKRSKSLKKTGLDGELSKLNNPQKERILDLAKRRIGENPEEYTQEEQDMYAVMTDYGEMDDFSDKEVVRILDLATRRMKDEGIDQYDKKDQNLYKKARDIFAKTNSKYGESKSNEEGGNPNHDASNGQFTSGSGGSSDNDSDKPKKVNNAQKEHDDNMKAYEEETKEWNETNDKIKERNTLRKKLKKSREDENPSWKAVDEKLLFKVWDKSSSQNGTYLDVDMNSNDFYNKMSKLTGSGSDFIRILMRRGVIEDQTFKSFNGKYYYRLTDKGKKAYGDIGWKMANFKASDKPVKPIKRRGDASQSSIKSILSSVKKNDEEGAFNKLEQINSKRDFIKDGHYIIEDSWGSRPATVTLLHPSKNDMQYPEAPKEDGNYYEWQPNDFKVGGKMVKVGDTISFSDHDGRSEVVVSGFDYSGDEWEGPSVNGYVSWSSNPSEFPRGKQKGHGGHRIDDVRSIVSSSDVKMKDGNEVLEHILLNETYIQDQFGVFYRPVYVGENYKEHESDLVFEGKLYTNEGVGNCPFCKGAGKVTVEKLGLKDCPDCDGTGDIQGEQQMPPQIPPQIPQEGIPQQIPPQMEEPVEEEKKPNPFAKGGEAKASEDWATPPEQKQLDLTAHFSGWSFSTIWCNLCLKEWKDWDVYEKHPDIDQELEDHLETVHGINTGVESKANEWSSYDMNNPNRDLSDPNWISRGASHAEQRDRMATRQANADRYEREKDIVKVVVCGKSDCPKVFPFDKFGNTDKWEQHMRNDHGAGDGQHYNQVSKIMNMAYQRNYMKIREQRSGDVLVESYTKSKVSESLNTVCPECGSKNTSRQQTKFGGGQAPERFDCKKCGNVFKPKSTESCGCKTKGLEASISKYEKFVKNEINILKKHAKAGESVGLMYGLPTVRKDGKKIKGTLAYAGVSLNDRIYLPEELAKGHGKTLPLLLNHSSTAGAEEEMDRLDDEMRDHLENEKDYEVGEVTLTWDADKLTLFYEGVIENEFFQKEVDEMDMAVSLGIFYDSDSPKVCDVECYTLIKGAEFREVSLVYHAGFPIATIEAVEAKLKRASIKNIKSSESFDVFNIKGGDLVAFKDPSAERGIFSVIEDNGNSVVIISMSGKRGVKQTVSRDQLINANQDSPELARASGESKATEIFKYCRKCFDMRQFLPNGYDNLPRHCDVCGAEESKASEYLDLDYPNSGFDWNHNDGEPIFTCKHCNKELVDDSMEGMKNHLKEHGITGHIEESKTSEKTELSKDEIEVGKLPEMNKFYEELDEEEDEMPLGGSVNAEPKETDTVEQPIIVESVRSQSDFSVRGVSGMTISNTNGVEKYSFDPTQNYETNTVHFSVTEQGGTIFGEEIQMQPKMTTPEELTKEIESHPDVVFTDPDEDMLKKN